MTTQTQTCACVIVFTGKHLTNQITAASHAAQSRPLLVEAILAALAVPALCVSLTVNAVQPKGVPKAVPRLSIAPTTKPGCMDTCGKVTLSSAIERCCSRTPEV